MFRATIAAATAASEKSTSSTYSWLIAKAGALFRAIAVPGTIDDEGVEWHLEPGGWDGYDMAQPMFMAGIGPYVFAHGGYAAVDVNCDIRAQRDRVIEQFRNRDMKRIYEPGCGGANTLSICRKQFPQAELIGGDLSPALLRAGHFMSEMLGLLFDEGA